MESGEGGKHFPPFSKCARWAHLLQAFKAYFIYRKKGLIHEYKEEEAEKERNPVVLVFCQSMGDRFLYFYSGADVDFLLL